MGTVNPVFQGKNGLVVTVEALTSFKGGQLLIPQTGTTVSGQQGAQPAGAGALNCIGVAQSDALTAADIATYTTGTSGFDSAYPVIDASVPSGVSAVYCDAIVPILYAAGAVAYGDRIKCGAAGVAAKWITGTDNANLIVGRCAQPGGTAGGVVALSRILV